MHSIIKKKPIRDIQVLKQLVDYEHDIYPSTDSESILRVLENWLLPHDNSQKNLVPQLSSTYYMNDKLVGFYIVIPLRESSYESLLRGDLTELEITAKDHLVSDATKCNRIGLHVYHVEKFAEAKFESSFTDIVLSNVSQVIQQFPNIKVIGFSGYCVTRAGIDLFYNRWNCREYATVDEEHIYYDNESKHLTVVSGAARSKELTHRLNHLPQSLQYRHRCKMLVTRPNDFSIVWQYLNNNNNNNNDSILNSKL
jgi:hypothetical protein